MCKKPKKFRKKAVLVALAAIFGVSILAAPVSAGEAVEWSCYLIADGPQESVIRTSYVNPQLATPSLICFPEFKNIGKSAEELRACECTCDRYATETGGIGLLEDKSEVLLAEDCKNILNCICKDMDIPAFEHYRGMTPDQAREWYDNSKVEIKPREDTYDRSISRSTSDKSVEWLRDLAHEVLIAELRNRIKDGGGGVETLTRAQQVFLLYPEYNEGLTDFLIEETRRHINLQESAEWFETEVIQGREDLDKPTKDMTDSERKDYLERWNDASERYPSRQKSTYLTDGHMADLAYYLMDVTKDLTGVYVEDSGGISRFCPIEEVYVEDSGEETHKIEEIPDKQVQPTPTPTPTIRPTERPSTLHTISSTARPMPTTTHPPSTSITPTPIQDSDGDGWDDEQERRAGTNPHKVDTDGDGIWDPQDPNPSDPNIPPKATPIPTFTPGFEAIFVIAGIIAIAYLLKRRD
jgi:hypothetical protein